MIIAKLMGGLGNQMFQYAAARSLAETHKTQVYIDKSWFTESSPNVDAPREYELSCFALNQRFIRKNQFVQVPETTDTESMKVKLYNATKGKFKPRIHVHKENGYNYNKDYAALQDNTLLDGFWQTEKYFSKIAPLIKKDFTFTAPLSQMSKDILDKIKDTNSVSVHIRRGDYAKIATTNKVHGLAELDYYHKAVGLMSKKIKDPVFYVFSDDPEWCKENLNLNFPTIYVEHNKNGSEDMHLMHFCKNHIIANSTFSWWAAWLSPYKDKVIYAPKKWFNDTRLDTRDVKPARWFEI